MWLANRLFRSVRRLQAENKNLRELYSPTLPPAELRLRVGAVPDPAEFLRIGATVSSDIRWLLNRQGRELKSVHSVLDFGCGCGRIVPWMGLGEKLSGCDMDAEAIAWCQAHLPGTFARIDSMPPLPYRNASFDLIYAISVFTHMEEAMERAWLAELRRVLTPGGIFIASVSGPSLFETSKELPGVAAHRAELESRGFAWAETSSVPGMPDFYQNSFHLPEYVQKHWSETFTILAYQEQAIGHHQDAVVMTR